MKQTIRTTFEPNQLSLADELIQYIDGRIRYYITDVDFMITYNRYGKFYLLFISAEDKIIEKIEDIVTEFNQERRNKCQKKN